jgi:hypothetical protein
MKNNCSKLVDSLHKKERYAKESAHLPLFNNV